MLIMDYAKYYQTIFEKNRDRNRVFLVSLIFDIVRVKRIFCSIVAFLQSRDLNVCVIFVLAIIEIKIQRNWIDFLGISINIRTKRKMCILLFGAIKRWIICTENMIFLAVKGDSDFETSLLANALYKMISFINGNEHLRA